MHSGGTSIYPRGNNNGSRSSVEIDSISRSWKIVVENIGPFLACSLLSCIPSVIAYVLGAGALMPGIRSEDTLQIVLGIIALFILVIVGTALGLLIGTGMVEMTLKVLRGEKPEYSDIWAGLRSSPLGLLGVLAVYSFAVNIGMNLFYIPGLVIGALWMLAVPLMLDKKLGPIEALKASFHMMKDHVVMGSVVYLLASLAAVAGLLACCIGIFVTIPIYFGVTAVIYNDLKQADENPFSPGSSSGPLGIYGVQLVAEEADTVAGPQVPGEPPDQSGDDESQIPPPASGS